MRLTLIPKTNRGFTLMEVMIAIAIAGILSAIAIPNYIRYREKGLIAQAQGDLKRIQRAIQDLGGDTGWWPTHLHGADEGRAGAAGGGKEVWDLSDPAAGLTANPGWGGWQGPYMTDTFTDPWGNNYFMDEDFELNGNDVTVIGSFGPNGEGPNDYDEDDIILKLPAN